MGVEIPIETARAWLAAAEATSKTTGYGQALYSLEMAVEIALKSVLLSVHAEVPKVHDIRSVVKMFLSEDSRMPKAFRDSLPEYLATFEALLRARSAAGYGFEGRIEKSGFKRQLKELMPKCMEIVKACETAAKHAESRK